MKCCSEKILLSALPKYKGFTLPEVMAALLILAFVSSGVLVVINRCMASAADLASRMRAFEVARDNMEKLLVSSSVQETVEYGFSEKYPDIQWQSVVETFYEPVTNRMWVQAVCSAEYTDTTDEVQKVELTHWLTNVSKKQLLEIMEEKREQKRRLIESGEIITMIEEAADYLGVEVETVEQWVENGMLTTEDGYYIRLYLELYKEYDGNPPPEAEQEVAKSYAALTGTQRTRVPSGPLPTGPTGPSGPTSPESGELFWIGPDGTPYTRPELDIMPLPKLIPIIFDGNPA